MNDKDYVKSYANGWISNVAVTAVLAAIIKRPRSLQSKWARRRCADAFIPASRGGRASCL